MLLNWIYDYETTQEWKNLKKTIARLTPATNIWTKLGELVEARQGHAAIYAQGHFLVFGGFVDFNSVSYQTERCALKTDQIECNTQSPELEFYAFYPEVFLVSSDYCKNLPSSK